MKYTIKILFLLLITNILIIETACEKKSTKNAIYIGVDSCVYKKDDTLREKFMIEYDAYTFDLKQEEDSLIKVYHPSIEQQSPMIQSVYYLVKSAYKRSTNQFDSALYFANISVVAGLKDTASAYKPLIAALSRLTALYIEAHENDSAMKYGYLGLNLANKYNHKLNEAYSQMVVLYQNIGDTINMKRVIWLSVKDSDILYKPAIYNNLSSIYDMENKQDSVIYYLKKAENAFLQKKDTLRLGICYANIAQYYNKMKKSDSAKYYIIYAMQINKKYDNEASEDYVLLASLYVKENKNEQALEAYKSALALAKRDKIETAIISCNQSLARQYMLTGNYKNSSSLYDSAYTELIALKNNDVVKKVQSLESDYRIKTKQLEVDKLNGEKEATKKTIRLQHYILLASLLLFALSLFAVYQADKQRKLKLAKAKIESEKEIIELEQRLLRSQMNPHFIFNAIAGIRGNILNDEKEKAVFYLTKFSKLLRQILENSTQVYITLTEEINTVENYISLQQMRYENKFTHKFTIQEGLNTDDIEIPALLMQPFIENSIEHGFKGINYTGTINIDIQKIDPKTIQITIQDNGKGLETKVIDDVQAMKNKSLSLEIIQMQLAIITKNSGIPSYYTIKKHTEKEGVKVVLLLGLSGNNKS